MKSRITFIICFLISILTANSQVSSNGLVLYLPLNGNVNDSSSFSNNGVNYGAVPATDRYGMPNKAMYFNGMSRIEIPNSNSLNLINSKSISCWVNIPSNVTQNWYPTLVNKPEPLYSATYNLQLNDYYGYNTDSKYKFDFYFASGTTHFQVMSKQLYTNLKDQWLHIVSTYDTISGYSKFFLNGVISDSLYIGKKIANSSNSPVYIGCGNLFESYNNYKTCFNGYIDDVLLYNRALSPTEINKIYTEKLLVNAGSDKNAVCGGSVKLDSVTTNYSGTGKLKYKWTPTTGLNNDSIANPVCTPSGSISYTVTVSDSDGNRASDNVTVSPKSFSPINTSTIYKYINCGESVRFDTILTNYSGTGKFKYKWSPSTGLNSDTIARPTFNAAQSTNYTVNITAPGGCSAVANVYVKVYSNTYYYSFNKTVSCTDTIRLEATTTIVNKTGLRYKWTPSTGLSSDTIANPITKISADITYNYTVTTPASCVATLGSVYITFVKTAKPTIALVGVKKNKNIIEWDKTAYTGVKAFNVYKETNIADSYSKIGVVPYDSAGIFVDTLSFPKVQSNRYKLSMLDKCGFETDLSTCHKTMHLSINKGVGTSWNLIWEPYEGFTVSTYNIYRGTSVNDVIQIGTLSGNNNQFSDFSAPTGDVYYSIEAIKSTSSAIKGSNKAHAEVEAVSYTSRSNIATNVTDLMAINDLKDISNLISIYPNPASDNFEVMTDAIDISNLLTLKIYNFTGQIVKSEMLSQKRQSVNISNLSNGVYFVEFMSDKRTIGKRLIVRK